MLDYGQQLFGNNNWAAGSVAKGCAFVLDPTTGYHAHRLLETRPLFLHFSNAFFGCYDHLGRTLGYEPVTGTAVDGTTGLSLATSRRRLNYGTDAPTASPTYVFLNCRKIRKRSWCQRRTYCNWSKPRRRVGRFCDWVTPPTGAPTTPTVAPTGVPTVAPTTPTSSPTYAFMDCSKIRFKNWCTRRESYCKWTKPGKKFGRHCEWITPPTESPTTSTAAPTTDSPTIPTSSPTYAFKDCTKIRRRLWCSRRDYCQWGKPNRPMGRHCSWVNPPTNTPTAPTPTPTTGTPTVPTDSPTLVIMDCAKIRVRGWCTNRPYCKWTRSWRKRGRFCRDAE